MGSANSLNLSDGTSEILVQEPGIYTHGPYNSGEAITIAVLTDDINCDSSVDFAYSCPPTGATCVDPLLIDSLPYSTSDDTVNYLDDYEGTAGESCGSTFSYLNGDDVVYSYTSTVDGAILVELDPTDTLSLIHI